MPGQSLFRAENPGGKGTPRRRRGERSTPVPDRVAEVTRLELELERACARYERAIAALDEHADRLEHPSADEIVRTAMAEPLRGPEHVVRLSSASFEDLRGLGLSVTQARRILKLRDGGALESTARLDSVPGIPGSQVAALKLRLID